MGDSTANVFEEAINFNKELDKELDTLEEGTVMVRPIIVTKHHHNGYWIVKMTIYY